MTTNRIQFITTIFFFSKFKSCNSLRFRTLKKKIRTIDHKPITIQYNFLLKNCNFGFRKYRFLEMVGDFEKPEYISQFPNYEPKKNLAQLSRFFQKRSFFEYFRQFFESGRKIRHNSAQISFFPNSKTGIPMDNPLNTVHYFHNKVVLIYMSIYEYICLYIHTYILPLL